MPVSLTKSMTKEEKEAWRRALAQLGKELFPEGNPVEKAKKEGGSHE